MQHVGNVVGPVNGFANRYVQRTFQTLNHCFRNVFPLIDISVSRLPFAGDRRSVERYRTRFNLVAVIVTEPGYPGQPAVTFELKTNLFVDTGFGLQVIVAHHVATNARRGTGGVATLAFAVQNVVRVELVQAWCFIGSRNPHLEREVITQTLGQVQRWAPVVTNDAVVVETQTRRQHGAVGQFHVVFSKQRENLRV